MSEKDPGSDVVDVGDEQSFRVKAASWLSSMDEPGFPWRKLTWVGLGVLGLSAVVYSLRSVLTPIVLSLVFAYVLDPAVDWLERRGASRVRSIAVLLVCGFVGAAVLIVSLVPVFAHQVQEISEKLPEYQASVSALTTQKIVPWVEKTFDVDLARGGRTEATLFEELSTRIQGAGPSVTRAAGQVVEWFASNLLRALLMVINILLIPVFTFYFLRDWDHMVEAAGDLMPRRIRPVLGQHFAKVDATLAAFLRGQLTVCFILSLFYCFGLWVFGCPMYLVVGIVAGIAFLIPYLGTAVGIGLGASLTLFHYGLGPSVEWTGIPGVVLVVAWFVVVQLIEGTLITPRVIGESVGLHPVVVMVAIIAGGELLGLLGILLAVPFTAAAAVFVRAGVEAYRESAFYASG